jgi:hypothetical protein
MTAIGSRILPATSKRRVLLVNDKYPSHNPAHQTGQYSLQINNRLLCLMVDQGLRQCFVPEIMRISNAIITIARETHFAGVTTAPKGLENRLLEPANNSRSNHEPIQRRECLWGYAQLPLS